MKSKLSIAIIATVLIMLSSSAEASPGVTAFYNDLAGFNAVAESPPIVLDFDSINTDTDITGQTINEVTFTAHGAPLIVVKGEDTFTPTGFSGIIDSATNKLFPTSGSNILSPGGTTLGPGYNPSIENDDLKITFAAPVSAVGMDILFQSLDGASFVAVEVCDSNDELLYSNSFIPMPGIPVNGGAPGGALFAGFVSDSRNIASITFDEFDSNSNNPDSNIGYDTIRFTLPVILATLDIDPDTLNLMSNGEWITTYIELPENYDVNNIVVSTITLKTSSGDINVDLNAPATVGDYDNDDASDLMVKFERSKVVSQLSLTDVVDDETGIDQQLELMVVGELTDGTLFKDTDTVRVIKKGK